MSDPIRLRVTIRGAVQGVGFRVAVWREAEREGVAGWVGNRHDGAVEAALEGSEADVARVLAFCHVGPRGARVDSVEAEPEAPRGETGFEIH